MAATGKKRAVDSVRLRIVGGIRYQYARMNIKEPVVLIPERQATDAPVICLEYRVSQQAKTAGQIHVPYNVVHQSPLSAYAAGTLTAVFVFLQLCEMAAGAAVITGWYLVV